MPSATYRLFREAILNEKQVVCTYESYRRELCPLIVGYRNGEERVLAFQFAGQSSKPLPRGGDWKCFALAKVRGAKLRDGPWFEGGEHRAEQTCIDEVDLDINIHVRRLRSPARP
jgi:hypothetical protein